MGTATWLARGVLTVTLALVMGVLSSLSHEPRALVIQTASASIASRDEADEALAEWAIGRFEQAGLVLPGLTIAFHDEKAECEGRYGYFRASAPAHVDICGFNGNRFLVTPKRTILHELAHAWAHENLSEDSIQAFLRFRALDTWNDPSTPWEEKGFEHAAEIMAWALLDEDAGLHSIPDTNPAVLAAAYELLTSLPPPPR
jgi:hypothetical protein